MDSRLNTIFQQAVDAKKLPGIGAIVLDVKGNVLYKGAFGSVNADDPQAAPMTLSTPTLIFSLGKLVTTVAALQLLEQGKIKLDDPVEKYVPRIAELQVLDGFGEDGKPILRAPKSKPTIIQLMTHSSGLTYDFFDPPTMQWRIATGSTPAAYLATSLKENFTSPLACDPGTDYHYGISTDWLGYVIEGVTGMGLRDYIFQNIINPLGMKDSTWHVKDDQSWLYTHHRLPDGGLKADPTVKYAAQPEVSSGGGSLSSSANDYSTLLLTVLNNGTHPTSGVKLLEPDTVKQYLFAEHLSKICSTKNVGHIDGSVPPLSNYLEMLPGVDRDWSCALMLNKQDMPNGRPAGSGAWAGMGNCYYWLDQKNGKLGCFITNVLPFVDKECLYLADELERATYDRPAAKEIGEEGSNFKLK